MRMSGIKLHCFASILFLLTANCHSTITIKSNPSNLRVSLFDRKNAQYEQLGRTPLTIDSAQLKPATAEQIQLKITRNGHLPTYLLLPKDIDGDYTLSANLLERNSVVEKLQKITLDLVKIQATLARNKPQLALQQSRHFALKNRQLAVSYLLLAEIYLQQDNVEAAHIHLKKASKLAPKNKVINDLLAAVKTIHEQ